MTEKKFLYNINKTISVSSYNKERIKYFLSVGDFTSIRLILDKIIDEIDLTIDRLSNKQLLVNVLNKQKEVCNSMMDYIINMIEISYNMKREDEGRKDVGRTVNKTG